MQNFGGHTQSTFTHSHPFAYTLTAVFTIDKKEVKRQSIPELEATLLAQGQREGDGHTLGRWFVGARCGRGKAA